jgi:hypothetical protein
VPWLSAFFSPIGYLARHCPPNSPATTDAHYRPDTPDNRAAQDLGTKASGVDKQSVVENVPLLGMTTVLLVHEGQCFLRPVLGHVGMQTASDRTEHASANFLIE